MGESTASEKSITSGRLICDTYLLSKDLVKSNNYSLNELAYNQLNFRRNEIPHDALVDHFWKLEGLGKVIGVCECDAYLALQLMFKLQMVPLTMALTRLAGNLWYGFFGW